jgi:hypothetical protein
MYASSHGVEGGSVIRYTLYVDELVKRPTSHFEEIGPNTPSSRKKASIGPSRHRAAGCKWRRGTYGPPKEKFTATLGSLYAIIESRAAFPRVVLDSFLRAVQDTMVLPGYSTRGVIRCVPTQGGAIWLARLIGSQGVSV